MRVSIQDIYNSYKNCHKGKAKSIKAQVYSAKLIDNLFDTHKVLHTNSYQAKPYTSFIANNGFKPREIFASDFYDRVVHHFIVPKLEKVINHKFIYHSCANQVGKGTHFGVSELQKMIRKQNNKYYLQLDIFNFFYSIDKKILLNILSKHLKIAIKKRQLHLQQARDYYQLCVNILQKPESLNNLNKIQLLSIPQHKQLKNTKKNKALPIGNLTSQFFGNMYLNELDQFIKHKLKICDYLRFVDDFVLLGNNKQQLELWQKDIEKFLHQKLSLNLKDEKILKPVNDGVDFLGYIIFPHYKLIRKRVVHNFYVKLNSWQQKNILNIKNTQLIILNNHNTTLLTSLVASYLGHFKHAKYYKILQQKVRQFPWLSLFFYKDIDSYKTTFYNKNATKFSHQVYFFNTRFKDFIVLIQKGKNFITSITKDDEFSLKFLDNYLEKLKNNNQSYIFISEQGYVHNKLKQRKIQQIFTVKPLLTT